PQGTVVDSTYVGDATVIECETDSGLRLTSKVLNQSGDQIPTIGSSCRVRWAATDAAILTN
ncbi:TOBE domain-containing protein, partial [Mesorhizobium sp. M4B.F.Ca.ET.169.01.1.1]|uniref:TOBE domain-containing protein n=1 Tax=Mesorhizobium sp. M4B.F.Ca.ET.169.01.1.1 TaxID=2563949 RepID=UPI001093F1F3